MQADTREQRAISGILGTVSRSWEEVLVQKYCVFIEVQMNIAAVVEQA
jgi:hypothetical protein